MSIYAIGDLHLSMDPRINKPMDIFGPAWCAHHLKVQENWLAKIKPEDTIIICGDISWGLRLDEAMMDLQWISHLPGRKVITKGNHDLWWTSTNRLNTLFDNIYFMQNTGYFVEDIGIYLCGTRGWITPGTRDFDQHDEKIYRRELLRLEMSLKDVGKMQKENGHSGLPIIASIHYPPASEKYGTSGFTEMLTKYGVSKCIYGHLHGEKEHVGAISGCVEGVEYSLVALDYIDADPLKIW